MSFSIIIPTFMDEVDCHKLASHLFHLLDNLNILTKAGGLHVFSHRKTVHLNLSDYQRSWWLAASLHARRDRRGGLQPLLRLGCAVH